jgi:prefoldin subunit 5
MIDIEEVATMAFPDAIDFLHREKDELEKLAETKVSKQVKANRVLDDVDERLRYIRKEEDNLSQFWRDIELQHAIAELEDVARMLRQ